MVGKQIDCAMAETAEFLRGHIDHDCAPIRDQGSGIRDRFVSDSIMSYPTRIRLRPTTIEVPSDRDPCFVRRESRFLSFGRLPNRCTFRHAADLRKRETTDVDLPNRC